MSKEAVRAQVTELQEDYGRNAYLLYAMGLEIGTNDYDSLRRYSLLDHPQDRKIDFFYLNSETRRAIVAQGYVSEDWGRPAAPANKASDLNTAASWLLDRPIDAIPDEAVRKTAEELRDGLNSGEIETMEFIYVHNLPESVNVEEEILTLDASVKRRIRDDTKWSQNEILVRVSEHGINTIAVLQEQLESTIRIDEEVILTSSTAPQELYSGNWRATTATVSGDQFSALVVKYGADLYSSNVRDYLGSRNTARNINKQIERTAREHPADFWVFNNGVTIITHEFTIEDAAVKCRGLSVVNGAQTIGSLGTISGADLAAVLVPTRVVEPVKPGLAIDIIRFNNTQNPIKAWELRSIDPVQSRLLDDFESTLKLKYELRRGISRRSIDDIHFEKLAPWLSAFYGDPQTPHRNRREIYEGDARYAGLFNATSNVHNLAFIYRIGETVGASKDNLRSRIEEGVASAQERSLYGYFQYGAFQYVAIFLVSETLAAIYPGGDPAFQHRVTMVDEAALTNREAAIAELRPMVQFAITPVATAIGDREAYQVFRSREEVQKLSDQIKVLVMQQEALNPTLFDETRAKLRLL